MANESSTIPSQVLTKSDKGATQIPSEPLKTSLLAPGPVNLHPEVRKILALPMIHHRTPEFDQILKRVLQNIKKVFQTSQEVYLLSATGSGGMECALINTLQAGDKVIAIVSGKFGERWAQMAQDFGGQVITLNVPWGEAVNTDAFEALLKLNPDTKLVLCQACETSTAVAHPIQKLGEILAKYDNCLFLVDAITALGAYALPMDEWEIDAIVGGSQKAFMLPTGMAFVSFSTKAWNKIETNPMPRYYFDMRKEKKANGNGETFFSSNVSIIRALDWVLNDIEKKTLIRHFHEIQRRAQFTRDFGQRLGLTLYSKSPSESVTALQMPASIDGQKVRQHMEEQFGITIMGGQDQAKGKIIRVGHMGYIQDVELVNLVRALGLSLQQFDETFISTEKIATLELDAKKYLEQHL
jgi:aspartate aminotransferase-like enzyme